MSRNPFIHPYIPNAEPGVKAEMLEAVGASDIEEFYADIPSELRYQGLLDLPPAITSEAGLERHIRELLARNQTCEENLSFLGAGCYRHHVPAVCDEINSRGEFLTAYAGQTYTDHGKFQALFEYASMMGELLNMDVVNVPTYDGYQAAATALRMAARITGRDRALLAGTLAPERLSKFRDYCRPDLELVLLDYDPLSGQMSLASLEAALDDRVAAVYFENPSYLGFLETQVEGIVEISRDHGALVVVNVNPISLGVLAPPADYGADIVCGDLQPLGIHMQFGGGHGGFIATRDDPTFVMEYPSRLYGIAPTQTPGEFGFGDVAFERTSFAHRDHAREFTGTAANLWAITAGVYLALMGPQGMAELGESIMTRAAYAMRRLDALPGVRAPYFRAPHFNEFVVNFDESGKTVQQINRALREHGIFGGKDLSREFPELGQSALYCVTELHSQADIDRLVDTLSVILAPSISSTP
ncbi:MAG: aminomethyl-transferring glycine dehydrogenase subunit GcvPA [Caldilineae bacterium]|nr:MAG: aminomethyl-transferring glycine dehydrogenase subunit GcvPA [Caldilineae bacterium]